MIIKSTNLSKSPLMEFFQVMKLIAGYLGKEDMETLKLAVVATAFLVGFDTLDAAVKQADKSGFTTVKRERDSVRDNTFVGFMEFLRSMTRYPDPDVSEAARRLLFVTEKYGKSIQAMAREQETSILHNWVGDMRQTGNVALLEKLTHLPWIDKIDEENTQYEATHISSTEEKSTYVTGLTDKARKEMQKAFENLCEAINSHAFIDGETPYIGLADKINVEVANAQQLAKSRATLLKNKKKKKQEKQ
ncbi:MAG TPA: hypothetical protein DDZ96_11925 [Porphyromonadaceae bacterium]|jgi:hypothetical protein|nr:hypothetical protein [Porphyromonadaceae bacterium]HBL34506.1 hypothetical protein [Porphyromonadaceae bacterium]HBX20124.1 hypothetical protein [Porphyromonadaceae bacterium]HCM22166.1 hypothetical protein [Porphyromonadaceae bacterium]